MQTIFSSPLLSAKSRSALASLRAIITRRGGIIRGSEEGVASTAVDWSVTGGHRMRGLSIIEVPCRDERLAKQGLES